MLFNINNQLAFILKAHMNKKKQNDFEKTIYA